MTRSALSVEPFRISRDGLDPFRSGLAVVAEKALGLNALNRVYDAVSSRQDRLTFAQRSLDELGVTWRVADEDLRRIPRQGPLVVVANHPFGGLEALILQSLLCEIRPDVKLLANYLLSCIPDMRDSCFFVDPFDRPDSGRRNLASMRAAIHWVRQGHGLAIFPAGEVSHLRLDARTITDPRWSPKVARIIQMSGATVVPVFFDGYNSKPFQLAGLLHPRLRTIMLPWEMLSKRGTRVSVCVGSSIPTARVEQFTDPEHLMDYLRVRTYVLKARAQEHWPAVPGQVSLAKPEGCPVAHARPAALAAAEVQSLPPEQTLLESGHYLVGYFRAQQGPNLLHEIGRQRELAFRDVGEGTGRELDLDRFDQHYLHLFVWHRQRNQLIGAYRMGLTDELIRRSGIKGLYTSTLFNYPSSIIEQIGPALELGRSFVRREDQTAHMPLMLLWRGIGRFVALHPAYKKLFGVVSISNRYHSLTQQLLAAFLRQNYTHSDSAEGILPRNPPQFRSLRDWSECATSLVVRNLEDMEELVGEIETDLRGMPVLLRQYLKLNARLLGLNVDPEFGHVLDALMVVDLTSVEPAILVRYMGKPDTDLFFRYHGRAVGQSAAGAGEMAASL